MARLPDIPANITDPAVRTYLQRLKDALEPLASESLGGENRFATVAEVNAAVAAAVPNSGSGIIWTMDVERKAIPDGFVFCNGEQEAPDMRNLMPVGAGDTYVLGDHGADYYALNFVKKR